MRIEMNQSANPRFGMAVKMDKSAYPVIKDQFLKLGLNEKDQDFFVKTIGDVATKQIKNPIDIIIKESSKKTGKLAAELVDTNGKKDLGKLTKSETIFHQEKDGQLGFLDNAQKTATVLNTINYKFQAIMDKIAQSTK